jgi:hypothetical protein
MDPLSALGLAGNVVQFVQFATSLFKGTKQIYLSASGISDDHESLEDIYEKLLVFCTELEAGSCQAIGGDGVLTSDLQENSPSPITELASRCAQDCRQLLKSIDSLRVKSSSGPRFWRCLRVALMEVLKVGEMDKLQERITSYQRQMVLNLCSLS